MRSNEVSAYARAGRQCRHNLNYWSFGDYSHRRRRARQADVPGRLARSCATVQPREPRRYLAASDAELTRRVIAARELPFEFMLNALRLTGGFDAQTFPRAPGSTGRGLRRRCRPRLLGA